MLPGAALGFPEGIVDHRTRKAGTPRPHPMGHCRGEMIS